MNDKFFLDSNVCVYAFDVDSRKKAKALDLIVGNQATVSTQVLMETANVAAKKLKFKQEDVQLSVEYIAAFCSLHVVKLPTISLAFQVARKHQYSLYDSLIIVHRGYAAWSFGGQSSENCKSFSLKVYKKER